MSAFQDFGPLSERRRAEKQQKQRKRIMIFGAAASVLVILAVVGVAAVVYRSKNPAETKVASVSSTKEIHAGSKYVKMLCSPTDYKEACEKSLGKFINSTSSPKDLVKAAISAVSAEIAKAFSKSELIKSDDPMVKGAIEDCKKLYEDAKEELGQTLASIDTHHLDQLPTKSKELRNWLSAVMSYQETCIDGFPEGELKSKMKEAMKLGKQLTSNSLAIIGKASSFLKSLQIPGLSRRLLSEEEEDEPEFDHIDGFPSWVSAGDRRLLKGNPAKQFKPNVTVAKDGSGDFTTINAALAAMPKTYKGRYLIYVKSGIYAETVEISKKMENITMYGDGSRKSVVTGSKNFVDGTRTFETATFAALGYGFMAMGMGFSNTAGAIKHQAVALRVQSDASIFLNCRMDGFQDTLYAQTHRQYYRSCVITGTVDFIFGDSASVFQNCVLALRRPLDNQQNILTAHGRVDRHESTGFVLHNCRIVADASLAPEKLKFRNYLGRPWKEFSRNIVMESEIGDLIQPDGYMPWEGDFALNTLFYGEYNNRGPGADTAKRVKWAGFKVMNKQEALGYTPANFIDAGSWVRPAGVPVRLGLYK